MTITILLIPNIYWTHKGHKLAWNDPIKISVFNFFVVFIFLNIKHLKVVPALLNCFLET